MIFDEFDGIHASDEIKQKTLHNVMKQRSRKKRTGMTAALTLCVTCLLVVLFQPWRLMELLLHRLLPLLWQYTAM